MFDFENGISDWEKTGTAFDHQPTYGDNPTARNRGQPAKQQGDWWIGGFENRPSQGAPAGAIQGDGPQGTLTSPRFKIVGADMTFLIGGGCTMDKIRVELIIDGQVRNNEDFIAQITVCMASTDKKKTFELHLSRFLRSFK